MIEMLVTDLPLPDSPTRESVEPRSIEKLTSSTAFTVPARVKKCVLRFLTSRIAAILRFLLEIAAQTVRAARCGRPRPAFNANDAQLARLLLTRAGVLSEHPAQPIRYLTKRCIRFDSSDDMR